jgi:hypothetical protein
LFTRVPLKYSGDNTWLPPLDSTKNFLWTATDCRTGVIIMKGELPFWYSVGPSLLKSAMKDLCLTAGGKAFLKKNNVKVF